MLRVNSFSLTIGGGRKETSKKHIKATAFLVTLAILAFLIPFFGNIVDACHRWHHPYKPHHPPLGKTIIKHFVYPDGSPIGECLEVELWDDGNEPIAYGHTDTNGIVVFSNLPDGTYTFEYSWQGIDYEEMVRINCERIVWEFWNEVPYWTVEKTFYYDDMGLPVSHLPVTMNGWSGETDENGLVVFSNVPAGSYTIEWVWGGETQYENIEIGFQTPSPVVLTNRLTPKSGGVQ